MTQARWLLTLAACAAPVGCVDPIAPLGGPRPVGVDGDLDGDGVADGPPRGTAHEMLDPAPRLRVSGRADLAWKRQRALENDLLRGLALPKASLCNELDAYGCVDEVHTAPLGGNDPFGQGQLTAPAITTATTPLALDRLVLAGCVRRAALDAEGTPEVFTSLDLSAPSLVGQQAAVDATTDTLFRRLLSRDATDVERAAARALVVGDDGAPLPARDVAVLLCFAVGTSVETLFY